MTSVSSRPSLPRCHGYIAPRNPACRAAQRASSRGRLVKQQGTGEDGQVQVQEREDEQLVPEDVAAIPLAMPATGGDTGVQFHAVAGCCLEQMKEVQAHGQMRVIRLPRSRYRSDPGQCATWNLFRRSPPLQQTSLARLRFTTSWYLPLPRVRRARGIPSSKKGVHSGAPMPIRAPTESHRAVNSKLRQRGVNLSSGP